MSEKWVLASNNSGKLREINKILADTSIELIPQSEFGFEEAEETGLSFIENSILKARHASEQTGLPAIADDSGLEVSALNGAPGIYSARYSAEDSYQGSLDKANVDKLLTNMLIHKNRKARFVCVITLIKHAKDPTPSIFEGFWEGEISRNICGEGGFGYDPVFFLPEFGITSAQLDSDTKNKISHRGQALKTLKAFLKQPNNTYN